MNNDFNENNMSSGSDFSADALNIKKLDMYGVWIKKNPKLPDELFSRDTSMLPGFENANKDSDVFNADSDIPELEVIDEVDTDFTENHTSFSGELEDAAFDNSSAEENSNLRQEELLAENSFESLNLDDFLDNDTDFVSDNSATKGITSDNIQETNTTDFSFDEPLTSLEEADDTPVDFADDTIPVTDFAGNTFETDDFEDDEMNDFEQISFSNFESSMLDDNADSASDVPVEADKSLGADTEIPDNTGAENFDDSTELSIQDFQDVNSFETTSSEEGMLSDTEAFFTVEPEKQNTQPDELDLSISLEDEENSTSQELTELSDQDDDIPLFENLENDESPVLQSQADAFPESAEDSPELTEEYPKLEKTEFFDDVQAVENTLLSDEDIMSAMDIPSPELETKASDKSTELLMHIAGEITGLKAELNTLKEKLSSQMAHNTVNTENKSQKPVQEEGTGFFDDDGDETIALTGDELNTILNTSDENVEPVEGLQNMPFGTESIPVIPVQEDLSYLDGSDNDIAYQAKKCSESISADEAAYLDVPEKQNIPVKPLSTAKEPNMHELLSDEDIADQTCECKTDNTVEFSNSNTIQELQAADAIAEDKPLKNQSTFSRTKKETLLHAASQMKKEKVEEPLSLSPELKNEIKSVLSYMDHLLEALPEQKIEEFAKSEHFETYKHLFEQFGLS